LMDYLFKYFAIFNWVILFYYWIFRILYIALRFELRNLHFHSRYSTAWANVLENPFGSGYFEDGVLWTICLAGFQPWSSWSPPPK
jgi:hypothetical protein